MTPHGSSRTLQAAGTLLLAATNFLAVFDGLVATVALPAIQRELDLSGASGQWVLTAYAVPLGGMLLLGGRCGDRFGRRRILMCGLALFAVGLVLSGLAPVPAVLFAGRALQGAGAALAVPSSFAIISAFASASRRDRTFAAVAVAGGTGSAAGALIGGLITQGLGWRYVFFLLAPVALIALTATPRVLAPDRVVDPGQARRRLDVPAALLSVSGTGLLVLAVTQAEHGGPLAPTTLWPLAPAVVLLLAFVFREHRTSAPLLRLSLLRDRTLAAAVLATPGQVIAYDGTVFAALLFFQQVLRYSPLEAGLAFSPLGAAVFCGAPLASRLLRHFHWASIVAVALTCCAGGLLLLTAVSPGSGYFSRVLPPLLLLGFASSVSVVCLNIAAGRNIASAEKGVAYGTYETSKYLSMSLVIAGLATVIAARGRTDATGHGERLAALASGFHLAFVLSAALALAGGATAFLLTRGDNTSAEERARPHEERGR